MYFTVVSISYHVVFPYKIHKYPQVACCSPLHNSDDQSYRVTECSSEVSMVIAKKYESIKCSVMSQPVILQLEGTIIHVMIATAKEEFCSKVHYVHKNIQIEKLFGVKHEKVQLKCEQIKK